METAQLRRQPRPLTLHKLSRQAQIPERVLIHLVRREQIHGRSGRYDPDIILGVLAGLDIPYDALSVRKLRTALRS